MTRMARVRAAMVAIRSSGQMMVAVLVSREITRQVHGRRTDDRGWYDYPANSDTSHDQQSPKLIEVVNATDGERATAGRHQDAGDDEQLALVATEGRQKPQYDAAACEDREADG